MPTSSIIRSYSELKQLKTFDERFNYLVLDGNVAGRTFGGERYLNQAFYRSPEWKHARQRVIARDMGYDLGIEGHPIVNRAIIHHMNPILPEELKTDEDYDLLLDPEYLITVNHLTHNAIHYSDRNLLPAPYQERRPGDTDLW